jgi:hypothetical protein
MVETKLTLVTAVFVFLGHHDDSHQNKVFANLLREYD